MKPRLLKGLSALLLCCLTVQGQAAATYTQASTGEPASTEVSSDRGTLYQGVQSPGTLNYLLHLPDGYETSGESYPLLFFLHGIAQKGTGSAGFLENVADDGPFRTMREGRWDQRLPLIVVGPQSSGFQPWWRGEEVRKVLEHVMATYRVDSRRRYVAGISMGGRGSWWLAKNFSNEFAALVPVSGWAGDVSRSCEVFRGMAIWAFHGAKDPLIGIVSGRKPIDNLLGCNPLLAPVPKITVFDDVGHGNWDRVFASTHYDSNVGADGALYSDIYQWMLTFTKGTRYRPAVSSPADGKD